MLYISSKKVVDTEIVNENNSCIIPVFFRSRDARRSTVDCERHYWRCYTSVDRGIPKENL